MSIKRNYTEAFQKEAYQTMKVKPNEIKDSETICNEDLDDQSLEVIYPLRIKVENAVNHGTSQSEQKETISVTQSEASDSDNKAEDAESSEVESDTLFKDKDAFERYMDHVKKMQALNKGDSIEGVLREMCVLMIDKKSFLVKRRHLKEQNKELKQEISVLKGKLADQREVSKYAFQIKFHLLQIAELNKKILNTLE